MEALVAHLAAAPHQVRDNPCVDREEHYVIYIARLGDALDPDAIAAGVVLVVGAARAWSWAVIDVVADGFVHFRQISAWETASRATLVAPLPRSA